MLASVFTGLSLVALIANLLALYQVRDRLDTIAQLLEKK